MAYFSRSNCDMRKLSLVLLVIGVSIGWLVSPDFASAAPRVARALSDVCAETTEIGRNGLWKWEASDHINRGDPRAKGPSLICSRSNKRCVQWSALTYHCDGTKVTRGVMRRYGTWRVTGADRGYTSYGNSSSIRRIARQKGCSSIYIQRTRQRGSTIPDCYSVSVSSERSGTPF